MDVRRIGLFAAMAILGLIVFLTLQRMNAPDDVPVVQEVQTIVEKVEYNEVLSVIEPLQRGHRIRPDDLDWISWPSDAVTPALLVKDDGAEVSPIEALDGAVVRDSLLPGEPVTYSRVIRAGEAGVMAALLKPGMRAVTVRISVDTASGGFIQPGDKVDVVLRESVDAGNTSQIVANTVFSDVTVLAIDQSFRNNPDGGAAIPGSTATLELSPRDAEDLIVAQAEGELSLILRGFAGANSFAGSRATRQRRSAQDAPPLTIYRSGSSETVFVQEK